MAEFDVVIVGAGIAGGLAADALTKAGLKVIVLEAGPNNQSRGPLMKRYYASPIRTPESPLSRRRRRRRCQASSPSSRERILSVPA